jgi:hypothetical protein
LLGSPGWPRIHNPLALDLPSAGITGYTTTLVRRLFLKVISVYNFVYPCSLSIVFRQLYTFFSFRIIILLFWGIIRSHGL